MNYLFLLSLATATFWLGSDAFACDYDLTKIKTSCDDECSRVKTDPYWLKVPGLDEVQIEAKDSSGVLSGFDSFFGFQTNLKAKNGDCSAFAMATCKGIEVILPLQIRLNSGYGPRDPQWGGDRYHAINSSSPTVEGKRKLEGVMHSISFDVAEAKNVGCDARSFDGQLYSSDYISKVVLSCKNQKIKGVDLRLCGKKDPQQLSRPSAHAEKSQKWLGLSQVKCNNDKPIEYSTNQGHFKIEYRPIGSVKAVHFEDNKVQKPFLIAPMLVLESKFGPPRPAHNSSWPKDGGIQSQELPDWARYGSPNQDAKSGSIEVDATGRPYRLTIFGQSGDKKPVVNIPKIKNIDTFSNLNVSRANECCLDKRCPSRVVETHANQPQPRSQSGAQ
ncbi:MAG: hypothetical protein AB7H97_20735 [Pseudobdellovibrionaceae bacterium]